MQRRRRPWYAGGLLLAALLVVEASTASPASIGERGEVVETVGLAAMLMLPVAVAGGAIAGVFSRKGPVARAMVWLISLLIAATGALVAGLIVFWSGNLTCGFEGAEACGTSSPERLAGSLMIGGCFGLAACIALWTGTFARRESDGTI